MYVLDRSKKISKIWLSIRSLVPENWDMWITFRKLSDGAHLKASIGRIPILSDKTDKIFETTESKRGWKMNMQ